MLAPCHEQDDRERDGDAERCDDRAERGVGDQLRREDASPPRSDQVGTDDRAMMELAGGGECADEEQHQRGDEARADRQGLACVGRPAGVALADVGHCEGRDQRGQREHAGDDGPGPARGGELEPFGADEAGHRASSLVRLSVRSKNAVSRSTTSGVSS